jgi:hypothetical protein
MQIIKFIQLHVIKCVPILLLLDLYWVGLLIVLRPLSLRFLKTEDKISYCYMLGFLGNMTSAPCCVTMGSAALLRFLSNATIETEGLLTSSIGYERNN